MFECVQLLALKLNYLVTIIADNVVVIRVLGIVGIINFVLLAEIHLMHQPAFSEQRQGAIDGGAGNTLVNFARPL